MKPSRGVRVARLVALVAIVATAGCRARPELRAVRVETGKHERLSVGLEFMDADRDREVLRLLIDPALFAVVPPRVAHGLVVDEILTDPRDGRLSMSLDYDSNGWTIDVPMDIDEGSPSLEARVRLSGKGGSSAGPCVLLRQEAEFVQLTLSEGERWLKGEDVALPPPAGPR